MTDYRDKRVLVTGGHGFIGRPLSRQLAALGAEVVAVSRTRHADFDGVRSVALDLADRVAVDDLFAVFQPDIVLHLASHVVGARSPGVVLATFHSNLTSTVHLLMAAKTYGCERVVLTGSLEEPDAKTGSAVPSSPYAAAKAAATSYGRMFHALFGLSVVMLRVFMVYGPGQADMQKLVPYVITTLKRGKTPRFSSGTRQVDWVYVDDVVRAFELAGLVEGADGKTIDVGSGTYASVREVVEMLFSIMKTKEPPAFGGAEDRMMEQVRLANIEETGRILGWKPRVTLAEGLLLAVRSYSEPE